MFSRKIPTGNTAANSQAAAQAAQRKKALEVPRSFQRARMEAGPTTYTIAPKSNVTFNENNNTRRDVDIFKAVKARQGGGRR